MRYVTVSEMKKLDRRAIAKYGIPASFLMENAGKAITGEAVKTLGPGSVFIFCGYGNNGGDGFVAARLILAAGCPVKTFLAGNPKPFSPETRANYEALIALGHIPAVISAAGEIEAALAKSAAPGLVVDAIFGIGVRGALGEFYVKLINKINDFGCPVIAADVPSGLDADTGEPLGAAVKAVKTVTMGYPKAGFKNPEAKQYTGEIIVADIGLSGPPRKT